MKRLKELQQENSRLRRTVSDLTLDELILQESLRGVKAVSETVRRTVSGRTISPARRREKVREACAELGVSERRARRVLGQPRSTQRRVPRCAEDDKRLTADIVWLATTHGRYGYRRITALLRRAGWAVNARRVERIWLREGLQARGRQTKKGRPWLTDGSCIRLRPERAYHV